MQLDELLQILLEKDRPFRAVLSNPRFKKEEVKRIDLRPVLKEDHFIYQATYHYLTKNAHENFSCSDIKALIQDLLTNRFKQGVFFTSSADYHVLVSGKGQMTILKKKPLKAIDPFPHNRVKKGILLEGEMIPFLVELGVMNKQGRVIPAKQDKFRQINRFLEIISDIIDVFDPALPLKIVDFGCGKSYLTFALYHYLVHQQKRKITISGLDLKVDVIKSCKAIAQKLGYSHLHFAVGDIANYEPSGAIDMVVSLHACDTATDAAIAQAIMWKAKVILAVPCCQHELYRQIQNSDMTSLLKHGILRERFAALATDAARANLLEMAGYKTQVMEFIDLEHTPKNLLIRSVKKGEINPEVHQEFQNFKKLLGFDCALERLLNGKL